MDNGLTGVILVASVCIGLVLSVFGAILWVGIDVLFSPPVANDGLLMSFLGLMLLGLILMALSFRGKTRR